MMKYGIISINKYSSRGIKPILMPRVPPPGKYQWLRQIAKVSQITPITKNSPTISDLSFLLWYRCILWVFSSNSVKTKNIIKINRYSKDINLFILLLCPCVNNHKPARDSPYYHPLALPPAEWTHPFRRKHHAQSTSANSCKFSFVIYRSHVSYTITT